MVRCTLAEAAYVLTLLQLLWTIHVMLCLHPRELACAAQCCTVYPHIVCPCILRPRPATRSHMRP